MMIFGFTKKIPHHFPVHKNDIIIIITKFRIFIIHPTTTTTTLQYDLMIKAFLVQSFIVKEFIFLKIGRKKTFKDEI